MGHVDPPVHSLIRPLVHRYWRAVRGVTLGVRGVAIDSEGQVLLVRHTYTAGWHLPGGGVEPGETAVAALHREIREEACIEVLGAPRLHGLFFNQKVGGRDHVAVYVVPDFRILAEKTPDREIAEARFFSLDALPEGVTGPTRRRIDEIAAGAVELPQSW